jgi:peptidoglycan/LPS O-acetylase OafA/YrhL
MIDTKKSNSYLYTFDLLKFIAAIIVALLHYNWEIVPQGYLCVEFFFIINGMMIAKGYKKLLNTSCIDIIKSKLSNIYLYYIIILLLTIIYQEGKVSILDIFKYLFFYQYLGLAENNLPFWQIWYIAIYIIVSIFYVLIIKIFQSKYVYITIIISITLLINMYNLTEYHSINMTYEITLFGLPFGMVRGIVGIGVGIIVQNIADKCRIIRKPLKNFSILVELILCILLFSIFIKKPVTTEGDFISYVLISILLLSLSLKSNFISFKLDAFLSNNVCSFILSLSLPIYIFHTVVIRFFDKYNTILSGGDNPLYYIIIVLLVSIVGKLIHDYIVLVFKKINNKLMI